MKRTNRSYRKTTALDQGFTLIEVMISMVILMVGLLMMLALFTKGFSASQFAHEGLIAKQKAHEQLEAIYAARNNGLPWENIDNSGVGQGIFRNGFNTLYRVPQGAVGQAAVLGSEQSFAAAPQIPDFYVMRDAAGTFQQIPLNANNYQRQIVITDPPATPNLKQITVTVRVNILGLGNQFYSVNGLIANGQ